MAYKDYWKHTEEERAKLSVLEVQELLKYELMQKSVLEPPVLQLEPEEPPKLKKDHYYKVSLQFQSWGNDDIKALFHNPVDARTFLEMEWMFEDYEHSEHCARPRTEQTITSVELPTYDEVVMHQAAITTAREARSRNEEKKREYEKQLRVVEEATKDIWSDWHRCRDEAAHLEIIRGKYQEYFEMAEDTEVALKFLLKVPQFECSDIVKALPEYAEIVHDLAAGKPGPENNIPAEVKDDPDMSTDDVAF